MTELAVPGGVELAFAHQPWTTAVHLETALRRRCQVKRSGPGQPDGDPASAAEPPLLWVESGVGWFPPPSRLSGPSAAYLIDTHRGWRWRAAVASAFGTAFVAQRGAVDAFASVGVPARWLPLAVPAELCDPGPPLVDRPYDVAMVGHIQPGSAREEILAALGRCCSVAPVSGRLTPSEMMAVYRSSRVVVNIPLANDLNMRAFEALGARSGLVTGPMDGMDDLLGEVPVVVPADHATGDWVAAVRATVEAADQERADAGHRLATSEHTYDRRVEVLLAALADQTPQGPDPDVVSRRLAAGWARWGAVGEVWRLAHSPALTATAVGWRGLSVAKRVMPNRRAVRWAHSRS